MDLLAYMHESDKRGYLLVSGRSPTSEQLARMTGCDSVELRQMMTELESANVFSRDENNVVYCRRMAREAEYSESMSRNGKRGGRPRSVETMRERKADRKPRKSRMKAAQKPIESRQQSRDEAAQKPTPKPASASASLNSEAIKEPNGAKTPEPAAWMRAEDVPIPVELDTTEFRAAWELWLRHRRERREKYTPTAAMLQLRKLVQIGPDRAILAIEHSAAQGWQGVFEPKADRVNGRQQPAVGQPGFFDGLARFAEEGQSNDAA